MNIFIFTDKDLDGAGCVLVTKWLESPGTKVKFVSVNEQDFRTIFTKWWASPDAEDYDKVMVCDLNIADSHVDVLDHSKITIVDHHVSHGAVKPLYKHATLLVNDHAGSSTKLLYATYVAANKTSALTSQQYELINFINDYDSYTLRYPESLDLNTVFFSLQGDRVKLFIERFIDGYKGFDDNEKNIIKFHKLKVQQTINELKVFKATIPLDGESRVVCSAFADYSINDVAQHLINTYGAEIAIVINLKNKTVSFRRSSSSNYDLSILAKKLANGAGHKRAAGGVITDQLLAFSNIFKPI